MDVKLYYVKLDTEVTRNKMKHCITWKNHRREQRIWRQCGRIWDCLQVNVKTFFAYLIHSFHSLIENKSVINYIYGSMEKLPENKGMEDIFDRFVCNKQCGENYAVDYWKYYKE